MCFHHTVELRGFSPLFLSLPPIPLLFPSDVSYSDAIKMQQIQMIISNGSSGRSYSACSAKFLQFPVHNFTSYLHLVPIYCLTLKNFEPWHHLVIYKFSWNVLEGKLSLDGSTLSCTCIHSSRGQQSVFISQNWENGSCRKKHTTLD